MKKDKNNNRYKIISEDLQKNLIEFLDEIQFDAAAENDKESMHKINFCNWAIKELLNGYDAYFKEIKEKPNKKTRNDYVDETFMDWNLPEMTDEEYEKLVDQFDAFLRGWEKEYNKKHPDKPAPDRQPFNPPHIEDVAEYMSLDEVKDYLLSDDELSDEEAFDLYYDERERRREKKTGLTYEQLLKVPESNPQRKKIKPYHLFVL